MINLIKICVGTKIKLRFSNSSARFTSLLMLYVFFIESFLTRMTKTDLCNSYKKACILYFRSERRKIMKLQQKIKLYIYAASS